MQQMKRNKKLPLFLGILTGVIVLGVALGLLLIGILGAGDSTADQPTEPNEAAHYDLYWNLDSATYKDKENGMTSRQKSADGYYHIRFFIDGEIIELPVSSHSVANSIDVRDIMGLEFDQNGVVVGVVDPADMPLTKVAWQYYVKSVGKNKIKLDSSATFKGLSVELELSDETKIYDMTGISGPVGSLAKLNRMDRVYMVQDQLGQITHVFIYYRGEFLNTTLAYCEHCKEETAWGQWLQTDALPLTSGHYILSQDVYLQTQQNMDQDAEICLDLNGKTVEGKQGVRLYSLYNTGCELALMDTSEAQTGKMIAHGKDVTQGFGIFVRYGKFSMYGGTVDGSDVVANVLGTTIWTGENTVFNLHGGTVIGGTAKYGWDKNNNIANNGVGGAVVINSMFNMSGGTIRDGKAEPYVTQDKTGKKVYSQGAGGNIYLAGNAVMNMSGGEILNGTGVHGGNIYLGGNATLNMSGGIISGGKAQGGSGGNIGMSGNAQLNISGGSVVGGKVDTGNGGNINASGNAQITLSGGSISGGFSKSYGGNVFLTGKGVLTMQGGTISGGTTHDLAGNIYTNGTIRMYGGVITGGKVVDPETGKEEVSATQNIFVVNGKLYMSGGRIDGYVDLIDTSDTDTNETVVKLSGSARIDGAKEEEPNLSFSTGGIGVKIQIGKLTKGAHIGVTCRGVFSQPTDESNMQYFFADVKGAQICYVEKCLAVGKVSCLCGSNSENASEHIGQCDGSKLLWSAWASDSTLPNTTGYWYLTRDVVTSNQTVIYSHDVVLDLNGFDVTYKVPASWDANFRLYRVDKAEKKDEKGNITYGEYGSLIITDSAPEDGVLRVDMSEPYNGKNVNGQAIRDFGEFGMLLWPRFGEITMYGGVVDGSNLKTSRIGTVIRVEDTGVFTMYGGTVIGCTSTSAQALDSDGNLAWNTKNGKKTTPKWNGGSGGSIEVMGTFNLHGGTVTGGKAYAGTGVLNPDTGLTCNASLIWGGNMLVSGTLNMTGGTISAGQVFDSVYEAKVIDEATGEVVTKTVISPGHGGNICLSSGAVMNMSGGVVTGGSTNAESYNGSGGSGGNIRINDGAVLNMSGGTITSGTSTNCGGNISNYGSLNITGGTIEKGKTASFGPNIFNVNAGLHMTGGTVAGDLWLHSDAEQTKVSVSGTAVILGGTKYNLRIPAGKTITVGKLAKSAKIGVNASGVFTGETEEANAAYFVSDNESIQVLWENKVLTLGKKGCICGSNSDDAQKHLEGCDGTQVFWQAWSENTLPSKSGYYCLAADINNPASVTLKEADVYLDINGHTVSKKDGSLYQVGQENGVSASLTVCDSSETQAGTLKVTGTYPYHGGVIRSSKGVLTIYGGTVDASELTTNHTLSGVAIAIDYPGSLYMYGGKVLGGTGEYDGTAITSRGTTRLLGGTVIAKENAQAATVNVKWGTTTIGGDVKIDGTVKTGVNGTNNGVLILNGDPVMDKLIIGDGNTHVINATGLQASSPIPFVVEGADCTRAFATIAQGAVAEELFKPQNEGYSMVDENRTLRLAVLRCVCGSDTEQHINCDGQKLMWKMWTDSENLPAESGNYILATNITNPDRIVLKDKTVILDLNGHTILKDGGRVYQVGLETGNHSNLTICDSSSRSGTIRVTGVLTEEHGGAIRVSGGSFTLHSGTIDASGILVTHSLAGGAIAVDYPGSFTMYNGTILGGSSPNAGTALTLRGVVQLLGGTITAKDGTSAAAVVIKNRATTIGGQMVINGTVQLTKGSLTLEGEISIAQLLLDSGMKVTVQNLGANVRIPVSAAGTFTANAAEAYRDRFVAAGQDRISVNADKTLAVDFSQRCVCGTVSSTLADHAQGCKGQGGYQWVSTNTLPTGSGHYILAADLTVTGSVTLKNVNMVLDLNGHTVTREGGQIYQIGLETGNQSTLEICDGSADGTGALKGTGRFQYHGGVVRVSGGSMTMYSGTIDASQLTTDHDLSGVALATDVPGSFTMYGGTILGGSSINDGTAITARGTTMLLGGKIIAKEGTATAAVAVRRGTTTVGNARIDGTLKVSTFNTAKGSLVLKGTPAITKLVVANDQKINAQELQTLNAPIPVTVESGDITRVFATIAAQADVSGLFTSAATGYRVEASGTEVKLSQE